MKKVAIVIQSIIIILAMFLNRADGVIFGVIALMLWALEGKESAE